MSRWLAIRCPFCGMWQGKEIRKDIKTASFKCKFCNKSRKIIKRAKTELSFIKCEDCLVTSKVVNLENKKLWEDQK